MAGPCLDCQTIAPLMPSSWPAQVDLTRIHTQDALDAEAVLTDLMRTAAEVEVTTDSEVTAEGPSLQRFTSCLLSPTTALGV